MEPTRTACAVRKASPSDLLAVVQLIDRSPSLASDRLSNRQRAIWERMTTTSDLTVYVAETGSEIVGTASMLLMPHVTYDCRPTAFIEAVLVAEFPSPARSRSADRQTNPRRRPGGVMSKGPASVAQASRQRRWA